MEKKQDKYSLIIIGSGPAGLTASIYASRFKIDHVVIGESLGGLAFEAHKVCNYPSEKEISGMDLMGKMQKHAESFGAQILIDKIADISVGNSGFKITTQNGKEYLSTAILLAIGTEHRRLDLEEEAKFVGKGVSYCATCDAMFYRDKTVAVVGGSNSAHTASLYLAEVAKKVYQIYRQGKLRGDQIWIEQVHNNDKIEVVFDTQLTGLVGQDKLEKISLDKPYQGKKELDVDGVFVEIGTRPQKDLIEKLKLETDESGFIKVTPGQETSQAGVWAAGDITTNSNNFRQIITACSEGAIAMESLFKFLQARK